MMHAIDRASGAPAEVWHIPDAVSHRAASEVVRLSMGLVAAIQRTRLPDGPGGGVQVELCYLTVRTPAGPARCELGDWIVRDAERAMFPLDDATFHERFALVDGEGGP